MRTAAATIVSVLILLCFCFGVYSISNYSVRRNELEHNTNTALSQTMKVLKEDRAYDIHTEEGIHEFLSDFTQNLILTMNSDSDLTIHVLEVDLQKGFLRVETVATYGGVNSRKKVTCEKSILFDSWRNKQA